MTNYRPIDEAPDDETWILLRGRNFVGIPMIPVVAAYFSGAGRWLDSASLRDVSDMAKDAGADWAPLPD